jgi:integrase/recombinase XerD
MVVEFDEWLKNRGSRPNTIKRYIFVATEFKKWHEETYNHSPFDPKHVSGIDLQDWKDYQLKYIKQDGSKLAISTINNKIESLKTYFRYLQDTKVISKDPAQYLKLQKDDNKSESPRWLDRIERTRLLNHIDNDESLTSNANLWRYTRNRAILFFMLHAGLRISEVADLQLSDIQGTFVSVRNGKGGKHRIIPMNNDLMFAYEQWIKQRGETSLLNVFLSQKKQPITTDGIQHIFRTLKKKTHISELTPHVLRHTFCHDLSLKVPIQRVSELAGHASMDITRRYLTSSNIEKQDAVNHLSSRKKGGSI